MGRGVLLSVTMSVFPLGSEKKKAGDHLTFSLAQATTPSSRRLTGAQAYKHNMSKARVS